MVYNREENFIEGLSRLAEIVYVKDGLKKDGTIIAREIRGHSRYGCVHASRPAGSTKRSLPRFAVSSPEL